MALAARNVERRVEAKRVKRPPELDLRVVIAIDLQKRHYCEEFAFAMAKCSPCEKFCGH
jgi:hypothetical protein